MISRAASIARVAPSRLYRSSVMAEASQSPSRWSSPNFQTRSMVNVEDSASASDAWQKSCFVEIDFTISDDAVVFEAVQRFAAYDIGCLITTNADGKITGVVSERDYIHKVALLGKASRETTIKEISTKTDNLITATPHDSVDDCMAKMLGRDIRHLPILDDDGHVVGMLSIKDCVKAALAEKEESIQILSNFAMGKGGTMVVD